MGQGYGLCQKGQTAGAEEHPLVGEHQAVEAILPSTVSATS
jgi:hypothetical protein